MPVTDRPNILLAVFDALSKAALESYPGDLPALQALAAESRFFSNAYTPNPQAGPARASLFTGLDPFVHGVWTEGVALPDTEHTFPQRLAQAGYRTWLCGRRHLSGVSHWTTEPVRPYEYTHIEWAHGPVHRSRQNEYLKWLQAASPERYGAIFPLQPDPDDTTVPEDQYRAMATLDDELSFNHWAGQRLGSLITSHRGAEPFLGIAGFVVGDALGAQSRHANSESLDHRALRQADSALSHLMDCLTASGHVDDTVVIVVAARGNHQEQHHASAPALAESQLGVPLFIRQPSGERKVVDQYVSTIDVAATVIELAQLSLPPRMQGVSLLKDGAERGWVLSRERTQSPGGQRLWHSALIIDDWKLVVTHGSAQSNAPTEYRLYNLGADKQETNDLAGESAYAAKLEDMIDKMIDARCALEDRTEPRIAKF